MYAWTKSRPTQKVQSSTTTPKGPINVGGRYNSYTQGNSSTISQGTGNPSGGSNILSLAGSAAFIGNAMGAITVNANDLSGASNAKKVVNTVADVILPTVTETSEAERLINKAAKLGGQGVKLASGEVMGISTVKTISTIGKVGKVVGVAGTVIAPFTELETSLNMYSQEEFNLVAQYNPEGLNGFATGVVIQSTLDAASWGTVRSFVKTPTTIVRLIPGKDPSWTDSYDTTINKAINSRSLYENILEPAVQGVSSWFK